MPSRSGSWWIALPLVLAGTLTFMSIGLLITAIATRFFRWDAAK